MEKDVLEQVSYILISLITVFGAYKAIIDLSREATIRRNRQEEEITKREEIKARENSLGQEALVMLNIQLKKLSDARDKDGNRITSLEEIIKSIEFMYKIIEGRMINPNHPIDNIYKTT